MRLIIPTICVTLACITACDTQGEPHTTPDAATDSAEITSSDTDASPPDTDVPTDPAAPTDEEIEPPPPEVLDPTTTGPHTFTVTRPTASLSTGADVRLRLFLPDVTTAAPVVVLSHGFQLDSSDYVSYGRHFASWGYVAILPDLPSGGIFSAATHAELAEHLTALLDWIDTQPTELDGRADPSRLALAGHSMGGKISLLVAAQDSRPDAVVGLDPVDAAGGPFGSPSPDYPSVTPELMEDIAAPLLLLGETVNATGFIQVCAPADDNFEQYFQHATSSAVSVEFLGANHMSFLDNPNCGVACLACPTGSDDPAETRMLSQGFATAFLEVHLKGNSAYETHVTGADTTPLVDAGLVTIEDNGR